MYDVVVLGGTLGVLLATALLAQHSRARNSSANGKEQPLQVAVVERGVLAGREQEWNCTRADLQVSRWRAAARLRHAIQHSAKRCSQQLVCPAMARCPGQQKHKQQQGLHFPRSSHSQCSSGHLFAPAT